MVLAQNNSPKGFNIYLFPSVKTDQLSTLDLKKLKPKGKPFIAESEILHYQKETHEFQIDYIASDRFKELKIPVSGLSFAVFVGDEAIYAGAFWTSLSSKSFGGIVINKEKAIGKQPYYSNSDFPFLKLELGYPSAEHFKEKDLRADEKIFKALENGGLLYEYFEAVGKCKNIVGTGKRHASWIFTFKLDSTVNENFPNKEHTFELFADFGGSKILSLLETDSGLKIGDNPQSAFNSDKEIVLKYSIQMKPISPKILLRDFWAKK